jgi:hypothetical protein
MGHPAVLKRDAAGRRGVSYKLLDADQTGLAANGAESPGSRLLNLGILSAYG